MVKLTDSEKILFNGLNREYNWFKTTQDYGNEAHKALANEYGHALHNSLSARGYTPQYSKSVLKNSPMSPEEDNFFDSVHAIEDLIHFINGKVFPSMTY